MFRRNKNEESGQFHGRGGWHGRGGHGGRGGYGKQHGHGMRHGRGRMHGGGPRQFREGFSCEGQTPVQAEEARADVRISNIPTMGQAEGVCPLCDNHCPLSAPACRQGSAYAASARNR